MCMVWPRKSRLARDSDPCDRILKNAGNIHMLTMATFRDHLLLPEAGIAPEI